METCSTCRCVALLTIALVITISLSAQFIARAIRNQTDVYLCMEGLKAMGDFPKSCISLKPHDTGGHNAD